MIYEVTIEDTARLIEVEREGDGYRIAVDGGPPRHVDVRRLPNTLSLLLDGRSLDAGLVRTEGGWTVDLYGTGHDCAVVDPRRKALRLAGATAEGTVSTSMPGRVITVLVTPGDAVEKGQPVVVVEAMKMENELKAPISGTVTDVFVAAGDTLDAGAKLLRIS
ncbi:MAG: acetyl-CoA carboxylase biotin carboxyl carrier protein subunit [Alphaproteobacteria bacterium]|nr:acetyl-CoA carboxylase biotin carboxyl carrier protein subunit [Alphaproteobacteria bacterium]